MEESYNELERIAKRDIDSGKSVEAVFKEIDSATPKSDFKYTMLKYSTLKYSRIANRADPNAEKAFASELVSGLAVEDLDWMISEYKTMLIEIGMPAVEALNKFIATEKTQDQAKRKKDTLYPSSVNYQAAKETLDQITKAKTAWLGAELYIG
jgi:hypothetical protein